MNRPNPMQISEAHDLLDIICRDETPLRPNEEERQYMLQCRDTLCWILGHEDRGMAFQQKIDTLKKMLGGEIRLIQ